MQFTEDAPGILHEEGGSFVGYWDVAPDNFGHLEAEVVSWVEDALNDPRGWGRAGVTFQRSATATPRVLFRVVETISGDPNIIGFTFNQTFNGDVMDVWLEAGPYFGTADLVNHEAAHASFFAEHFLPGSDSIMEPQDEAGNEWPSQGDIHSVRDWLGQTEPPETPDGNHSSYSITPNNPDGFGPVHWDLEREGTGLGEIRFSVWVGEPLGAVWARVVWSPTLAGLESDPQDLCPALPGIGTGHYSTGWRAIPQAALGGSVWIKSVLVPDGPGFEPPREYRPFGWPGRHAMAVLRPGPWLGVELR